MYSKVEYLDDFNMYANEFKLYDSVPEDGILYEDELPTDLANAMLEFGELVGGYLGMDAWNLCKSPIGWLFYPETDGFPCELVKVNKELWVDSKEWGMIDSDDYREVLGYIKNFMSFLTSSYPNLVGVYLYTNTLEEAVVYMEENEVSINKSLIVEDKRVIIYDETLYVQASYEFISSTDVKSKIKEYIDTVCETLGILDEGNSIHFGRSKSDNKYVVKIDFQSIQDISLFKDEWAENLFPWIWSSVMEKGNDVYLFGEYIKK